MRCFSLWPLHIQGITDPMTMESSLRKPVFVREEGKYRDHLPKLPPTPSLMHAPGKALKSGWREPSTSVKITRMNTGSPKVVKALVPPLTCVLFLCLYYSPLLQSEMILASLKSGWERTLGHTHLSLACWANRERPVMRWKGK